MFVKTSENTNLNQWNKIGIHLPEKHKDELLGFIFRTSSPELIDAYKERWLSCEAIENVRNTYTLISGIKDIDESIIVRVDFQGAKINKLVITSKKYCDEIFDKVTEKVINYEDATERSIDYYYFAESELTMHFGDLTEI